MQLVLLLDAVITEGHAINKLHTIKNQTLLIRRDAFLVMNFRFNIVNCVTRLSIKGNDFACQRFNKQFHNAKKGTYLSMISQNTTIAKPYQRNFKPMAIQKT